MEHWISKYLPIFSMNDGKLLKYIGKRLGSIYGRGNVYRAREYVAAVGKIPIIIVAHVDTVFPEKPGRFSMEGNVLKGVDHPLGADDRAGVVAILKILEEGWRLPSVILTTGEEKGGTGADIACIDLLPPRAMYIIELDRAGFNEAVFYNCSNARFEEYILSFGFKIATGTFSDISILCPGWGIAGVNLSVGYYNQHTKNEFLNVDHLDSTLERVRKMIRGPPVDIFFYTDDSCSPRQKRLHEYPGWK